MNEEEIPEQVSEEIPEEIPEEPQGPDILERARAVQRQYDLAQELRQKYKERQAKRTAAKKAGEAGEKAAGEGEAVQPGAAAAAKGGAPAEKAGVPVSRAGTKTAEQAGGQAAKKVGKEAAKEVGTEAAKTVGKQAGKEAGKTGAKGLLAASGLVSEGAGTAIAVAMEVADRAGQAAMKAISWIPGAKDFLTPATAVILFIIAILALTAGPVFGFAAGLGAGEGGDEPMNYPYLTNIDQILSYPETCDENRLAQVIDDHIRNFYPKSEMQGLGRVFVAEGKETGINPIFIVALAEHESRFGTDAGNHRGPNHALKRSTTDVYNPFGRTATAQQPHINAGGRRWYAFNSWEEAIRLHGDYLRQRYFDRGFNTLPKLMTEYAPPGENDTNGYVARIIKINQELLKEAGCQLSPVPAASGAAPAATPAATSSPSSTSPNPAR